MINVKFIPNADLSERGFIRITSLFEFKEAGYRKHVIESFKKLPNGNYRRVVAYRTQIWEGPWTRKMVQMKENCILGSKDVRRRLERASENKYRIEVSYIEES